MRQEQLLHRHFVDGEVKSSCQSVGRTAAQITSLYPRVEGLQHLNPQDVQNNVLLLWDVAMINSDHLLYTYSQNSHHGKNISWTTTVLSDAKP